MTFRDHFSRQAALYSTYRPSYPPELFEFLAGLAPAKRLAWDCATGSGQAAIALADYFERVVATDASAEQISHAEPAANVTYTVAPAHASGLDSHSADLITVAQALHWFDLDEFYSEVRRVAVTNGVIAVWGYGDPVMDTPALERIVHAFNRGTIEEYWTGNRDILLDGYRSIDFPFTEITAPVLRLEKHWTMEELAGYFRTWSATNRFIAAKGFDPVTDVERELEGVWGG
ncbi:MAG: class I SAM-dependent methyltransferase, partial [Gemmatimonadota bacterium]|nr:class I SAM-dependent methyltransferase [Gemmatimonadota bacterium]